ncbi:MAG: D-glycero-beta-D-manno-heptose 1-phosphate adenylyltransferase [Phycisphaerales bacterium]|nr:D-glycero-beta-D-manno-heptose 1-phosphate adenylyltransferase [Phycisphaerales bacterium]
MNAALLKKLADWKPFVALVVGDFMLDQRIYGDAERLTNDAPVPVLHVRRTEHNPGGAANVCMDLAAMHARVRAFGVLGADDEGRLLREDLDRAGIDTAGLVNDPARPTTVKKNLVGLAQHRHPQKMFRLDYESREPISDAVLADLLARFDAALKTADVVAIEDYNKGVCSERLCTAIIERCRAAGKPVMVDPAPIADYGKYHGCTAITPNRTEAERATGMSGHQAPAQGYGWLAHALRADLDADAVVLTLDKQGALLLERQGNPLHIPTVAREVYDVTGAGDMVLAALCAARANGIDWPDSVRFANAAAGLEVEIFGVQPIPFERIHQSIITLERHRHDKQRSLEEAVVEAAAARREGKSIVFTNGCFDILHAGHLSLVRRARAMGDFLILGVNSDDSIRRLKGSDRPVHRQADRVALLSELSSVDLVVVFDEDTPMRLLEELRPDVLVKGADYTKDRVVGADLVESYGGRVELVELVEGRSTTAAIERLRKP